MTHPHANPDEAAHPGAASLTPDQSRAQDSAVIGEDPAYQTRFWRTQRIAWVGLALFLAVSTLGLTGGAGWLSHSTVGDAHFSITYPQILRRQASNTFVFTIHDSRAETVILFDNAFQDMFSITSTSPPSTSAFATAQGIAYRFETAGTGPTTIRIGVTADRPARGDYSIVTHGRVALLSSTVMP